MKNDKLDQIWNDQVNDPSIQKPSEIIKKAKSQRKGQYITIAILTITVLVLLVFAFYVVIQWNDFTLGLTLMIASLVFRIILEFFSLYRKESQLITLDHSSFRAYLKKHYRSRLRINYYVTPICFAIYVLGFLKLLPYFKAEFSQGFYHYIVISGGISLLVLMVIIVNSIKKEHKSLAQLNEQPFGF